MHGGIAKGQKRQAIHEVDELVFRIMPEDDAFPVVYEEFRKCIVELFGVHG